MLFGLNENSDLILRWTQAGFSLDCRCFGDYTDSRAGSSDQPWRLWHLWSIVGLANMNSTSQQYLKLLGPLLCWIQEPAASLDELCKLMAKKDPPWTRGCVVHPENWSEAKNEGEWLTIQSLFSPQITWKWTMTARKTVTIFTKNVQTLFKSTLSYIKWYVHLMIKCGYDFNMDVHSFRLKCGHYLTLLC